MRNPKLRHALKTGRRERRSVSSSVDIRGSSGRDTVCKFVPVRGPEIVRVMTPFRMSSAKSRTKK